MMKMSKIETIIVHYTDGTYEELKSNQMPKVGELKNGSIVSKVEAKLEESATSARILLTEG